MDAAPILAQLAELFNRHRLEAILVGNAGAAIQGAPVTTVDIDFLFRKTPANIKKLKAISRDLDAVLWRPYDPPGNWFRLMRDNGFQIDFMGSIAACASFEELRRDAAIVLGGYLLRVAAPG